MRMKAARGRRVKAYSVLRQMWQRTRRKRWTALGAYWPKPRVRVEWAARQANEMQWRKDDAERARRAPWLNAEQVLVAVASPQPEGLPEHVERRRRLAERLLAEMAFPPYGRPGLGNDFVAATAVPTTLDDAPGAREALHEATTLARTRRDEVKAANGAGAYGLWMRVHGVAGSVVFSFMPPGRSVLICVDDLPDHCWQISGDTDEAYLLINGLYDAVLVGSVRAEAAGNQSADV